MTVPISPNEPAGACRSIEYPVASGLPAHVSVSCDPAAGLTTAANSCRRHANHKHVRRPGVDRCLQRRAVLRAGEGERRDCRWRRDGQCRLVRKNCNVPLFGCAPRVAIAWPVVKANVARAGTASMRWKCPLCWAGVDQQSQTGELTLSLWIGNRENWPPSCCVDPSEGPGGRASTMCEYCRKSSSSARWSACARELHCDGTTFE